MLLLTCSADAATRGSVVECTNAIVEICDTTDGLQTNPWAAACNETSPADSIAERLAVVKECAELANDGDRNANPRCRRTGAVNARANCILDPRRADCDDYAAETGEPFNTARLARYASGCATLTALVDNPDAALCPEEAVKAEICVSSGRNARPFALICGQRLASDPITDLQTRRNTLLAFCLMTGNEKSCGMR